MFRTIGFFVGFFFSLSVFADTIQRIEIVGSAPAGNKIAILRSHFGPSSYAPFVSLMVYEVKKTTPVFQDTLSALQGDEDTINQMAKQLMEKNEKPLQDLGIDKKRMGKPVDAIVTESNNQILIQLDNLSNGDLNQFLFLWSKEISTSNSPAKLNLKFSNLREPVENFDLDLGSDATIADRIKFSRVVKTGENLWFFYFIQTQPLEGLFFFPQEVYGVQCEKLLQRVSR